MRMERYIHTLPGCVTIITNLRIFQYNTIFQYYIIFDILTKCFTNLEKKISPFLCFCMEEPESPIYLIHSCTKTYFLWTQLQRSFQNVLIIPPIMPQSVIFEFAGYKVNYHFINHILLIFKYYVFKSRGNGLLDLKDLKRHIHNEINTEKQISLNKPEK